MTEPDAAALLDRSPGPGVDTLGTAWWRAVETSLTDDADAWCAAAGGLDTDRAWVLLGWADTAASVVARERRGTTLATAAQAVALLEGGPLDRRDVMVVGGLLHRAADLTGLDFPAAVQRGCARAGERGASCSTWLVRLPASEGRRPLQTATIRVTRAVVDEPDTYDRHAAVVRVDGEVVGRLRQGASLEVAARPGEHEVRIRLRYNPNRGRVRVTVGERGGVDVVCEKAFPARLSLPPSRYWRLTVSQR